MTTSSLSVETAVESSIIPSANPKVIPELPRKAAKRLISTKNMSREEWLQIRKQGIGASDAAAAVGLNPYQSQLELWMIKTGRDQHFPSVDPSDESTPMYWGNILEPIVAEHYTKHTDNKVRRVNAVLQHPDNDKPWMLANLDYAVVGCDDVQILECKTAGEFGSRLWRDGVPEYVQCQVQHQLAVTGKSTADVCVLLCGQEIKIYRIERDDALIARLIELERAFWDMVESDTPPAADGSDSAASALRYLYPNDSGQVLDLSEDAQLSLAFSDLVHLRVQSKNLQAQEEQLKQRIQQTMGDHTKAVFASGEVSWKRSKDTESFDHKALLVDHPELESRYRRVRPGNRRFLLRVD